MQSDGTHTNTWEHGRQLKQTVKAGKTIGYVYGYDGMRTHKNVTVSGATATTYYTYNGKLLTHYSRGSYSQHFYYDAQGRAAMVRFWDGAQTKYYTYVHNLQGDVVGLIDNAGALVVEYKYDAWGKPLSTTGTLATTLGVENPFRYRGYVYDEEMGYYYLRSRYYDPGLRRFINADSETNPNNPKALMNLYRYCQNNPTMQVDVNGKDGRNIFQRIGDAIVWFLQAGTAVEMVNQGFVAKDFANAGKTAISKLPEGTFSIQFTASAAGGAGVSVSPWGVAIDTEGNIGYLICYGYGAGSPSASAAITFSITTAPNIDKLKDKSVQAGMSGTLLGVSCGIDGIAFSDLKTGELYFGGSFNVGASPAPILFEMHGEYVTTYVIHKYNLFDALIDSGNNLIDMGSEFFR